MDWPLVVDIMLTVACVVLLVLYARQSRHTDELWKELDAQRAWLHRVDDGVRWEVEGSRVEAHTGNTAEAHVVR